MPKDKEHEDRQISDASELDRTQFLRDNRRVDTAQAILEFSKFAITVVQQLSHDDQDRARPRY